MVLRNKIHILLGAMCLRIILILLDLSPILPGYEGLKCDEIHLFENYSYVEFGG